MIISQHITRAICEMIIAASGIRWPQ